MLTALCLFGSWSADVFSCLQTKCQPAQSAKIVITLAEKVSNSDAGMPGQRGRVFKRLPERELSSSAFLRFPSSL